MKRILKWGAALAACALLALFAAGRRAQTRLLPLNALVDAASIELQTQSGTIVLVKQEGSWQIISPFAFTANGEFADSFIAVMADTGLSGILSRSPKELEAFGLGQGKASRLKVKYADGKVALDMLFSSTGPSAGSVFVTPPGETAVREAIGMSPRVFSLPPQAWFNRQVTAISQNNISALTISGEGKNVRLEFKEGKYTPSARQAAIPEKTALEALSAAATMASGETKRVCLSCETKATPAEKISVSVSRRDGPDLLLHIGAGKEKRPVWLTGRENELYSVNAAGLYPLLHLLMPV